MLMDNVLGSTAHKQAGKILPVTIRQNCPKDRDHDAWRQSLAVHEEMIDEDIHDHRSQQREPQRNMTIHQQEGAANRLTGADKEYVVRLNENAYELSGKARRQHCRNEIQKRVQAEDKKDQAKQDAYDQDYDFHIFSLICNSVMNYRDTKVHDGNQNGPQESFPL
jgi:hypothetical protein